MTTTKRASKKPAARKAAAKKTVKKVAKKAATKGRGKVGKKTIKKTGKKTAKAPPRKVAPTPSKSSATARKRRSTGAGATGRPLVTVQSGKTFWASDGQIIANLLELEAALERMPDDVFGYHVAKGKNDFADWVEQVLEDAACAAALRRSRKRTTARTIVLRRLKLYIY